MTILNVQRSTVVGGASGNYGSNITPANSVFVAVVTYSTSNVAIGTSAVTVAGQSLTKLAEIQSAYTGGQTDYISVWGAANSPGGSSAVSATVSNASWNPGNGLMIWEYSGLGAWTLDQAPAPATGNGTALSSGATGTLSAAAEVALGAMQGNTVTPAGLTTSTAIGGYPYGFAGDEITTTNASLTYSGTASTSGVWVAAIVTIAPGAAFIPAPNRPRGQAVNRASTY